MRSKLAVLSTAAIVVLAGCVGGFVGAGQARTGTVSLYVSDRPGDIEQFSSLEATVTKVAYRPADVDETGDSDETETDANETEVEGSNGDDGDDDGEAGLVVRDVNDTRVDLTRLTGANASLVGNTSVPAGNYSGVFVFVENVTGTVSNSGEQVDVTVPSGKLHVNERFEIDAGDAVDFVFDVTVVETGNGKYILSPVVSESGTDVPIEPVDEEDAEGSNDDVQAVSEHGTVSEPDTTTTA
ncbi:MAG: DUF4382 domain-containing protein [Halanaeroarchaeum sp.]